MSSFDTGRSIAALADYDLSAQASGAIVEAAVTNPATIINMGLLLPTAPKTDEIGSDSWFLRSASTHKDNEALVFLTSGTRKDASLGQVFPDLQPLPEGNFEIELGAILQERLGIPEGKPEYVVTLSHTASVSRKFAISNAMQIARYRYQDMNWHAIFPMQAWEQFYSGKKQELGAAPHVEFLPTVVAARYLMKGRNPEEALSHHVERAIDDFLAGINVIVGAQLVNKAIPDRPGILVPNYDRGSLPWIYVLVRGANKQAKCERLTTNVLRVKLVGDQYDAASWERVAAHIRGEQKADVATRVLRTAESYVHGGVNEFALLLLAIATETATSRFVYAALRAGGVSRKKLKDIEADLTFSIMLNTQVMALSPSDRKPEARLLGEIDRIRRLRNGLMHRGQSAVTNDEMIALADAARQYIEYLSPLTSEAESNLGSESD